MKGESEGSIEQPGKKLGSAQQETRTCRSAARSSSPPAIAGSVQFVSCGELLAGICSDRGTGFSTGSAAASAEEADGGSQARGSKSMK